MMSEVVVL